MTAPFARCSAALLGLLVLSSASWAAAPAASPARDGGPATPRSRYPVAADVERYRARCERSDVSGCSDLGAAYQRGIGVPRDAQRGVALFRRGCDGGDAFGCLYLAASLENGEGVARDGPAAAKLKERTCEVGDLFGCVQLGVSYQQGIGVTRDADRAAAPVMPCQD